MCLCAHAQSYSFHRCCVCERLLRAFIFVCAIISADTREDSCMFCLRLFLFTDPAQTPDSSRLAADVDEQQELWQRSGHGEAKSWVRFTELCGRSSHLKQTVFIGIPGRMFCAYVVSAAKMLYREEKHCESLVP